jgi:S-adenosylmethionine-diacylgycerolhomoserine-N-methlytransferase
MSADHGALMDSVYRGQRHIYDATRKYFLFGRDRLIGELDLPEGGSVLEIACGTGRNLAVIARRWPKAELFGLDISEQMLKSAKAKLQQKAVLAQGDATDFDPVALFGRESFDRVVLSFAISMIPAWKDAISHAAKLVAPAGSLKIVDFGDLAQLPAPLTTMLEAWLSRFHVTPRTQLIACASALAQIGELSLRADHYLGGYYSLVSMTRASSAVVA